ncbi:acetyltransferase [Vibrio sp. S4M6]|uniref:GNAT family N-acetyltransferase n=1 Tax=Vibrio sinus TaxID=2946865 RepID=UPI002029B57C|nr:GNAT family N-acetyltransferase [Vibrio sinus]MCL9780399.1 acetyltransferase [Vibrio sinus]
MHNFEIFAIGEQHKVIVKSSENAQRNTDKEALNLLFNVVSECFDTESSIQYLQFELDDSSVARFVQSKLPLDGENKLYKSAFYQLSDHWHQHTSSSQYPLVLVQSNPSYRLHPLRPPKPEAVVYKRFDCNCNHDVSFRLIDKQRDLQKFTQWMNNPRVAEFWEQAWSEEKLADFIDERMNDSHTLPLIGEFDGQPFGYVEAYWTAEDRLSAYYDAKPYDRGIHLLVGEENFRGAKYFQSWMKAISHYLFLDDMRTEKIVLEPRYDNVRLFTRIEEVGYKKHFEFNFPHKRSAFVSLERHAFFTEQW